jgi:hypothetical protein
VVVDVDARPFAPRGEARLHSQELPPPLRGVVVSCFLVGHRSPALGSCVAVGVITCPAARAAAPGHHPARSWVQPKPVRTAPRARTPRRRCCRTFEPPGRRRDQDRPTAHDPHPHQAVCATACKRSTCPRSPAAAGRWAPRVRCAVTPAASAVLVRVVQPRCLPRPSCCPSPQWPPTCWRCLRCWPRHGDGRPARGAPSGVGGQPSWVERRGAPSRRGGGRPPPGGPSGRPPAPRTPSHTVVGSKNV